MNKGTTVSNISTYSSRYFCSWYIISVLSRIILLLKYFFLSNSGHCIYPHKEINLLQSKGCVAVYCLYHNLASQSSIGSHFLYATLLVMILTQAREIYWLVEDSTDIYVWFADSSLLWSRQSFSRFLFPQSFSFLSQFHGQKQVPPWERTQASFCPRFQRRTKDGLQSQLTECQPGPCIKDLVRHVPSYRIIKNLETKNMKGLGWGGRTVVWSLSHFLIMSVIYLNVHT